MRRKDFYFTTSQKVNIYPMVKLFIMFIIGLIYFASLWAVSVHHETRKKRTRPISSYLDLTLGS